MAKPVTRNIWNPGSAEQYLAAHAAGAETGDKTRLAELLILALKKPLLCYSPALTTLKALPENPPGWLREKFGTVAFHSFTPARAKNLDAAILHVRDWIAAALSSGAAWTKEEKPARLLHFRTVEDAKKAADKAMREENARLQREFANAASSRKSGIRTVMTLKNGYRIVQLLTPEALDHESVKMGHCIGHGAYDDALMKKTHAYYSLRDAANNPHATMEVETKNNRLLQCKGKQNIPPVAAYFPSIHAFIQRRKFTLDSDPFDTGLWQSPDGKYYSVRRLPEGAVIDGNLDLSFLTDAVLPENLEVKGALCFNGARPPNLPASLKAREIQAVWCENGVIFRKNAPARIAYDPQTREVIEEQWYNKHGEVHRIGGPAIVTYDPPGFVRWENWYKNGTPHRNGGGPTIVLYRWKSTQIEQVYGYTPP